MLRKMEQFCTTTNCRRYLLLSYFDSKIKHPESPNSECCDNCLKQFENGSQEVNYGAKLPKVKIFIIDFNFLN